ncbi:MAG: hypothetical protein COA45_05885 [Zetaproteobacteria bacterium]|nr:MAG: hypothetical protein COA45_05885 [Zetaproteobacteria bacterium]
MSKNSHILEENLFSEKTKELEKHIENIDKQMAVHDPKYILKPDKGIENSVNKAEHMRLQEERDKSVERLTDHLDQKTEHDKNGNTQKLKHHEWLHDPKEMNDSNVLTHGDNGLSIAQVERSDYNLPLNGQEANAQLLLNNYEEGRWQDGGIHHYADAVAHAENYAADHEQHIQHNEAGFKLGMDYDNDL